MISTFILFTYCTYFCPCSAATSEAEGVTYQVALLLHCGDKKWDVRLNGQTICCEVPPHLQVVLPVYNQSVAEHVPHDNQVGLLIVHAHTIHTEELRQQGATVTLHYVLQRGNTSEFTCQVQNVENCHRQSQC